MLFGIEREVSEQRRKERLQLLSALAFFSVTATLCPVLNPRLPHWFKMSALVSGVVASASLSAGLLASEQAEKLNAVFNKSQLEAFKQGIASEIDEDEIRRKLEGKLKLVSLVLQYPTWMQPAIAQSLGVAHLIPSVEDTPMRSAEPGSDEGGSILIKKQKTLAELRLENEPGIDTSWLTTGFVNYPKIVVGAQNSGKSTFLKYLCAEFLRLNPAGELYIIDIHYDPEESQYLGLGEEELKSSGILVDTPELGFEIFKAVFRILEDRIRNKQRFKEGNPNSPCRIKVVCDEFQDFVAALLQNDQKRLYEIVESINGRQGRKYGVTLDLGFHNFKKNGSGIDSSVMANCGWLLMGNTICDTTLRLPADFDQSLLVAQWQELSAILPRDRARAAVFRRASGDDSGQNQAPEVVALPKLDIPKITLIEPEVADGTQAESLEEEPIENLVELAKAGTI
jgi:hypothetical protein